jgi:menaquinone-dependent protoporphyrinogen IX oxidase
MIPQNLGHKADYMKAYRNMLLNETVDTKKLHKDVEAYINKHKADVKDMALAKKFIKILANKDADDLDMINAIASLSNVFKDAKKHQDDIEKFLDRLD